MKERYQKGELAKEILKKFLVGGLVASCVVLPGLSYVFTLFDASDTKSRTRVKQAVRKMEARGLIIRRIKKGKEELIITTKGEQKLAEHLAEDLEIPKQKKWDKKWRVLMFDIPETKAWVRREVSWKIKDMGMKAIQNSVFVSPYQCKKEIDVLADHYFVKKYFIYLETDNIECEENLLEGFNLKNNNQ